MVEIRLYGTPACHLCEAAHDLLALIANECDVDVTEVDISTDDALMTRYGIRIPVIQRTNDMAELGWPFDLDALRDFINCRLKTPREE